MRLRSLVVPLAITTATVIACSSDDPIAPGDPRSDAGANDDGGFTLAELGLDTRPMNATCVAPARPPNAAPVALTSVYDEIFTGPNAVASPMLMAQRPGDGSRWFLAQRNGRIVSFNAEGETRDLRDVVTAAGLASLTGKPVTLADESGFHGMAFDPAFASNGRLYVAFATSCDGAVPICDDPDDLNGDFYPFAEEIGYLTSSDGGATFGSYTRLMHIGRWSQMHYSGTLAFGHDGFLYITSGDGLDDSAVQFADNLFGKVLRIDPHGTPTAGLAYRIPDDNPFAGGGGRPEIFAWGLRNPFRLSVDRATGEIWLGDVGQDNWEEVDRIEKGGNYGWPCREGLHEAHAWDDPEKCPSRLGLIDPVIDHAHGDLPFGRSVTGGYVYRGSAIAGFQGTYLYGDFIQKELRGLALEGGEWKSTVLNAAGPQDGYVSFAEDAAGEIYSVALFDQKIHKLVQTAPQAPSTFPERLSQTGCVLPEDPTKPKEGVIPFDVNVALWSDGADKERWLAIPDGSKIKILPDGDLELPIGSALLKTFSIGQKRVETRLFVRHDDGEWAGYSYEWNDAQTDATLLPSSKVKDLGAQRWAFPSRSECGLCHTGAAGRTLGLELGQLNRTAAYPATKRLAPQLATLEHIGLFEAPIGDAPPAYPDPKGEGPVDARARAYLHANCAGCHRPNGGGGRSSMDLRFGTTFAETNTCGATPVVDDFDSDGTRLVKPGAPAESILSLRLRATDSRRMPPLGRFLVDPDGVALVDQWISAAGACP